jgi:hypothetical protein
MAAKIACVFLSIVASLFPVICFGQPASAPSPICTPSDLDVHALPPGEAVESPDWHLFVLELQNIGTAVCVAPGPALDLLPKSDTNNNPYFAADDLSESARNAEYAERKLAPGDWAHLFIGWVSRAAPEVPCDQYSGLQLRLLFHPNMDVPGEPSIEVRHLWIRACFHVYVSGFRPGRFTASSHVPERWWRWDSSDRTNTKPTFPALAAAAQMARESPLLQLHTPAKRTMLADGLQLRLKFPRQADGSCALRILRKRESNGATIISVQQCPDGKSVSVQPVPQALEASVLRLTMQNMDLLPAHVGPLKYDVVAQVGSSVAPRYAMAQVDLVAHDPTPPKQATIGDGLAVCAGSQLKLNALPPVLAEQNRNLRAYEATNASTTACAVAGVPELRFLKADGSNDPFAPWRRCPNCVNELFAPRPNGQIDLRPGETAHFLVGATAIDNREDPWMGCGMAWTLELSTDQESVALPFGALDCATIDVSAWRQGSFDHDPLNVRWAKVHEAETSSVTAPVPPDCNKPELLTMGQPRMTSLWQEPKVGLSMTSRNFVAGQDVPLHIWLDNTGDEPVTVSSCGGLDYFKVHGFDLYDAYGHRVLRKQEAKLQEQCKTNPDLSATGWVCSMNVPITVAPHSCVTGNGYFYTAMLSDMYDLPPGEYTVHPRLGRQDEEIDEHPCRPGGEKPFHRDSGTDITFTIDQP